VRHIASNVVFEHYPERGYNYRMTDIQASIGVVQMGKLPAILEKRRYLVCCYQRAFSTHGLAHLVPVEPVWARSNWQSYCMMLPADIDQATFMQRLLDVGISTRRGVMCIHREPPFSNLAPLLPESEFIQDRGVILPLFYDLTEQDVSFIVAQIAAALQA
jgi:dTDP-4-amino-4,6-dideoxygalactose transaminase